MLDYANTRRDRHIERNVADGASLRAEGAVLVKVLGADGVVGVKPSEGVAGESYAGFLISDEIAISVISTVQDRVVGDDNTITLAGTPVAGTLSIPGYTEGDPSTTATAYSVNGNVVTFHDDAVGAKVTPTFRYSPTVLQAQALQGDGPPGPNTSEYHGRVGCILTGDIYTSEFDTTVDWSAATAVKMDADGLVTDQNGAGEEIPGASIIALPSGENPFLGIEVK